jgi:hypothetical protein
MSGRVELAANVRTTLPADVPVIDAEHAFAKRGEYAFQPDVVSENLSASLGGGYVYTIRVSGPRLTRTGKLHASHRDCYKYGDGHRGIWVHPPDWLRPHLVGPDVLVSMICDEVARLSWMPR